jgi:adenylate cyclase
MSNDTDRVTRKLKAILSADVKGYSLLMADDEVHTIETLKKYRSFMSDLIQQRSGRVVDNPGDNLLAEFASSVDAVDCAMQIQNRLKKENARFVEEKRLQFRIGVNIGDVVHDSNRIYGNGVNVAARIESLADPGGICISRNTYDHVKDKLDLSFEYLGEHDLKNIEEPVRVYRVLLDTESPKPLVEEELELPDKPSIAVLPFTNMSGDPSQEYFSDGLSESIINGLCKVSNLFVIARNSSFAYKSKAVSVKQIAKELGVRYILEGSVQRDSDRVRITAQLIDATTDYHMWSENYDRDLTDIFVLQDEITMKLIQNLQVELLHGEQAKLWDAAVSNDIKAYDKFMRGMECFLRYTKEGNIQARKYLNDALEIDPRAAMSYVIIGFSHLIDVAFGWSKSPLVAFEQAEIATKQALSIDSKLDMAHTLCSYFYLYKKEFDKAVEAGEKAVELNPNGSEALAHLATIIWYAVDNPLKSIELLKRAIRLNPIPPFYYYTYLGSAYLLANMYDEAIETLNKSLSINYDYVHTHIYLTSCYVSINLIEEAKEAAKEILRLFPEFSVEYYSMTVPFANQEKLAQRIDALRKAGLPD